jgi:hypothetical protein
MMDGQKRKDYVITKGDEVITAYLFHDEVLFWERKGYTVTQQPWPRK